jgi:hypothetical protein
MRARAPLDVDLEDRLVFGLSPQRFGYLAMAAMAAMAAWKSVPYAGFALALVVLGLGAALAWGRWRGRPADGWLTSGVGWAIRNLEVEIDEAMLARLRRGRLRVLIGGADP